MKIPGILMLLVVVAFSPKKQVSVVPAKSSLSDSTVVDTVLYGNPKLVGSVWTELISLNVSTYNADSIVFCSKVSAHYASLATRRDVIEYAGLNGKSELTQKSFDDQMVMRYHISNSQLNLFTQGGKMGMVYVVTSNVQAMDTINFSVTYYRYNQ